MIFQNLSQTKEFNQNNLQNTKPEDDIETSSVQYCSVCKGKG